MSDLLYVAGAIALLSLSALLLYSITLIKSGRQLVDQAGATLNEIAGKVTEQLDNVDTVLGNVGKLTDDVTRVVDDATDVVHEGKKIVVSLLQLEQTLQQSIQEPIVETVAIFGALGKGIRAFRLRLGEDRNGRPTGDNGYSTELPD